MPLVPAVAINGSSSSKELLEDGKDECLSAQFTAEQKSVNCHDGTAILKGCIQALVSAYAEKIAGLREKIAGGDKVKFVPGKPETCDSDVRLKAELKKKYLCIMTPQTSNGNEYNNTNCKHSTDAQIPKLVNSNGNNGFVSHAATSTSYSNGSTTASPFNRLSAGAPSANLLNKNGDNTSPQSDITLSPSANLPSPRFEIFPTDRVLLQWDSRYRCSLGVGLNNVGNTCFLNSVLQVLTNTAPLANYLLNNEHDPRKCPTVNGSCALCLMKNHVERVFKVAAIGQDSFSPSAVVSRVRNFMKSYHCGRQEDAHEFLRYFIDAMQTAALFPYNDQKLDLFTKETTVISRIFGGYHKNEIVCNNCHSNSVTFDPFLDLNVEVKQFHTLDSALAHYTGVEILSSDNAYLCPKCKRRVSAKKIFTIYEPPNVLTIQLKRFDHFGKIDRFISYPERLNLRPYMTEKKGLPVTYRLYAVIVHIGRTTHSGHYFAFARNPCDQWQLLDDYRVTTVSVDTVLRTPNAYLLFYIRLPTPVAAIKPQTSPDVGFIGPLKPPVVSPTIGIRAAGEASVTRNSEFKTEFSTPIATTPTITAHQPIVRSTPGTVSVRPSFTSFRSEGPIKFKVNTFKKLNTSKNGDSSTRSGNDSSQTKLDSFFGSTPKSQSIKPIQDNSVSSSTKLVPYDEDEDEEEDRTNGNSAPDENKETITNGHVIASEPTTEDTNTQDLAQERPVCPVLDNVSSLSRLVETTVSCPNGSTVPDEEIVPQKPETCGNINLAKASIFQDSTAGNISPVMNGDHPVNDGVFMNGNTPNTPAKENGREKGNGFINGNDDSTLKEDFRHREKIDNGHRRRHRSTSTNSSDYETKRKKQRSESRSPPRSISNEKYRLEAHSPLKSVSNGSETKTKKRRKRSRSKSRSSDGSRRKSKHHGFVLKRRKHRRSRSRNRRSRSKDRHRHGHHRDREKRLEVRTDEKRTHTGKNPDREYSESYRKKKKTKTRTPSSTSSDSQEWVEKDSYEKQGSNDVGNISSHSRDKPEPYGIQHFFNKVAGFYKRKGDGKGDYELKTQKTHNGHSSLRNSRYF